MTILRSYLKFGVNANLIKVHIYYVPADCVVLYVGVELWYATNLVE